MPHHRPGRATLFALMSLAMSLSGVAATAAARAATSFTVVADVRGSCLIQTSLGSGAADTWRVSDEPDARIHLACAWGVNARLGVDAEPTPVFMLRPVGLGGANAAFFKDPERTEAWGRHGEDDFNLGTLGSTRLITFPVYGRMAEPGGLGRRPIDGVAEVTF